MTARAVAVALIVAVTSASVGAHDGPPFPILSDHVSGAYTLSIWTDPDATDDGSPGGQFWVRLKGADKEIPAGTQVRVAVRPLERDGASSSVPAAPVRGDVTNQFAALVMDHEGRFAVQVTVAGPLGATVVEAETDATYDLRPPPYLVLVYAAPFILVGILWGARMMRRRGAARGRPIDIHS